MIYYFRLLRIQQWLKNAFIFLPLFFDRHILETSYLVPALVAFISYCLASSGIYCLNDIMDVESDRRHPTKCNRPVASGIIGKGQAFIVMMICIGASISFALLGSILLDGFGKNVLIVLGFHIFLNIAYCLYLKRVAIIDVFIISIGFVLRIVAGGLATNIWISHWIVLMTFLLALFLAFAKRRDDVVIYEQTGVRARKNVDRYNVPFLNAALTVVASVTMVCYIMYSVSSEVCERFGSQYVYLTSIFVLAGIIRYLQVALVDIQSGSPTKVLVKDHFIQACIMGWILMFAIILYL